jgi:GNAT superfamily N-acetyltransferase
LISIRLAMPEDKGEILQLAEQMVQETLPHLDFRRDMASEEFDRAIETGNPTAFVAESAGQITGFLICRIHGYMFTSGIFASQEVLFVRPDRRGTRAAALLIEEFLRWGEIVGAREYTFGVSNGFHPERTARLFERFGAERVGLYLKKTRH